MRLETADGVRCRAVDAPTIDPWSSTDTKASRSVKFIFPPLTCLLFGCTGNPGRFHKYSSKWLQFACCANCASKHFMVRITQNVNLDWHVTGLRRRLTLFGHRRRREGVCFRRASQEFNYVDCPPRAQKALYVHRTRAVHSDH